MGNLNGFDANTVEPSTAFEIIPAGKYKAVIVESEMKETKAGTGEYLELQFQIIEGPHEGRSLWTRLNLQNPNEQAVQIARGELSAICRAVGVLTPDDSHDLHDLPLLITVKIRKRTDTGEDVNEIRGFNRISRTTASDTRTSGRKPWERK